MMTLCPSFLNFTAVSTIDVRIESKGSCVFSSTMELVPGENVSHMPCLSVCTTGSLTELDDNAKRTRASHGSKFQGSKVSKK
jgi:hypothetical protein